MAEKTKLEITNNTARPIDLITGVKDGAAVTEAIEAGKTESISINPDDPTLRALIAAQAITVKSPTGDLKKAQEAARAGTQTKPTATEEASKPA